MGFGRWKPLSKAPTANPARSKSAPLYIPGISAVSPPINAQLDIEHPSAIPLITFVAFSSSRLPVAK